MKNWKIKKGHDFRIRNRHPWVFSNELLDSPKGVLPGEPIELTDMSGNFLALGYGNPQSLIAFRAMSFSPKENFNINIDCFSERLLKAWQFRQSSGFYKSFRLCYSEADQMPGLILDRYVFTKNKITYQVFSYQLLTAGMDRFFKQNDNGLQVLKKLAEKAISEGLSEIEWSSTLVLQKNDVNIRKLEGLEVEQPIILKTVNGETLENIAIEVQNVLDTNETIYFNVNLPEGQKTGFFLDQTFNIKLVLEQIEKQKDQFKNKTVKILDLCCYMGQWSVQIVANLKKWGINCEVHLVDVSELALNKAQSNLDTYGVKVHSYKKDVLSISEIPELMQIQFDVVISDPPAFVKNKKDLPQGLAAYSKLNTQALKLCSNNALIVSCTCSGAVDLESFKESLRKAILKSGKYARCIAYGGQGWDHPNLMSFPEGYYLKMVLHRVSAV